MKVRFTLEALTHIAGIRFYIEQRSPQAERVNDFETPFVMRLASKRV
jgi:hypothetical protein